MQIFGKIAPLGRVGKAKQIEPSGGQARENEEKVAVLTAWVKKKDPLRGSFYSKTSARVP